MLKLSQKGAVRLVVLMLVFVLSDVPGDAQETKRPFTVADDIALTYFGDPFTARSSGLQFSPDGMYFAVYTERGNILLNRVEDSLRFYRSHDIQDFLTRAGESQAPLPAWIVNTFGNEGPIVKLWRWLPDSKGVAFLEGGSLNGSQRLMLADLGKKRLIRLVAEDVRSLDAFDVRDERHYLYIAADPVSLRNLAKEREAATVVGTGRPLLELLFPDISGKWISRRSDLIAVVDGKRFKVKANAASVSAGEGSSLSPDGRSVATISPVAEVPTSWETLYAPAYAHDRIHAGHGTAKQYVRIDVQSGLEQPITGAPVSVDVGIPVLNDASSWSSDGQAILLPGTFLKNNDNIPSRPCIAVVDLLSNSSTCVETLKGRTDEKGDYEEGYHLVFAADFVNGDKHRVKVTFLGRSKGGELQSIETIEYQQSAGGTWHAAEKSGLDVTVQEGANEPPRLVATNEHTSRIIWDPNPQLKRIELEEVRVYKWRDKEGKEATGGLYLPRHYRSGQRYPLVIQTYGLQESLFKPSGGHPTGMAARALAAAGMVVLAVDAHGCAHGTQEAPCAVGRYEAAANQLVSEGLADPRKIGIIGFSRTCLYVMQALTFGSLHLKAASITDGVMGDYWQYTLQPERLGNEFESVIGARPFGEGLQQWLKQSPGFNLDKITTPLMIVGEGPRSLLFMWEPYSGLQSLKKPVEVMMLSDTEHILRNPAARMASQGGAVDWFRFWLQDYEDPDPGKKEQYERWRELRKMQEENQAQQKPSNN